MIWDHRNVLLNYIKVYTILTRAIVQKVLFDVVCESVNDRCSSAREVWNLPALNKQLLLQSPPMNSGAIIQMYNFFASPQC